MSVKYMQSQGEDEPLPRQHDDEDKPGGLPFRFHHPFTEWQSLPEEIRQVFGPGAASIPGDSGAPQDVKPSWYDEQLFREGQRVGRRNFLGICVASLMGVFLEYSLVEGMGPLISTERSTSPKAAGRRYLSTVYKFLSWYSGDPFDPKSVTYKNLVNVRRAHERVRKDLAKCSPDEREVKFTIGQGRPVNLLCPAAPGLERTFKTFTTEALACPAVSRVGPLQGAVSVAWDPLRRPYLSQVEMGLTQWSQIGVFALKPELFAAPNLTRREIKALMHSWAVFGYCLGIADRFNFALGDLDTVLKRAEIVLRIVVIPNFRAMDSKGLRNYEHVIRSIIKGLASYIQPFPGFMACLSYLTEDVLGQQTDLRKNLGWRQTIELWCLKFFLGVLPRWASWLSFSINETFKSMVRRSEAEARQKFAQGWK